MTLGIQRVSGHLIPLLQIPGRDRGSKGEFDEHAVDAELPGNAVRIDHESAPFRLIRGSSCAHAVVDVRRASQMLPTLGGDIGSIACSRPRAECLEVAPLSLVRDMIFVTIPYFSWTKDDLW
jgi:hypothetical protein